MAKAERKRKSILMIFCIISILICTAIAQWPALFGNALAFDDYQYLVENPLVRNPGLASAGRFITEITSPSTVKGYYQPLTMISLMIDYTLAGQTDNLFVYHLVSFLIHLANTLLVFLLLLFLFEEPAIALCLALFFGVHPMCSETICWIAERKTVLASFFALLSIILYTRFRKNKKSLSYIISVFCFFCGVLSKPTIIALPLCLLLLDIWPLQQLLQQPLQIDRGFSVKMIIEKIPFFAISFGSGIITLVSQGIGADIPLPEGSLPFMRIPFIVCYNIFFYIGKIIVPVRLSLHYPYPVLSFANPIIVFSLVFSLLIIAGICISFRRKKAFFTGFLFFFLAIFPSLGVVGFTYSIASNKFVYFPVIGLLLVAAAFLKSLQLKQYSAYGKFIRQKLAPTLSGFVIILEIVFTQSYLSHWKNTDTLFSYLIKASPSGVVCDYYGMALLKQGRIEEAEKQIMSALALNPVFARSYNHAGLLCLYKGDTEKAAEYFRKALTLQPGFEEAKANLEGLSKAADITAGLARVDALIREKRFDEAGAELERLLRDEKKSAVLYARLGTLYYIQNNLTRAEKAFQEAIRIDPENADAFYTLAMVQQAEGDKTAAEKNYRKAIALNPSAEMYDGLGWLYVTEQEFDKAAECFRQVVVRDPRNMRARIALASLLGMQGKCDEAISLFDEILARDPGNKEALYNKGTAYASIGELEKAKEVLESLLKLDPHYPEAENTLEMIEADLKKNENN